MRLCIVFLVVWGGVKTVEGRGDVDVIATLKGSSILAQGEERSDVTLGTAAPH